MPIYVFAQNRQKAKPEPISYIPVSQDARSSIYDTLGIQGKRSLTVVVIMTTTNHSLLVSNNIITQNLKKIAAPS